MQPSSARRQGSPKSAIRDVAAAMIGRGTKARSRIFALQNRATTDTGLLHEASARLLGSAARVRGLLR